MEANEMVILNPDITEVMIGTRKLRSIKVYPLSVVDQFKLSDFIYETVGAFLSPDITNDVQKVTLLIAILKRHMAKILEFVLDETETPDTVLGEMTNNQMMDIAQILYKVNYESISKNVESLLKKIPKTASPSVRQQPPSVESMDTSSMTSTENPGDKEE